MTEEEYKNLSETIESQQEELHRAQAEELQRRDQQLLHGQLLQQNLELREAHQKSLSEMEELKKFWSSTFGTTARRRLVEDHMRSSPSRQHVLEIGPLSVRDLDVTQHVFGFLVPLSPLSMRRSPFLKLRMLTPKVCSRARGGATR